MTRPRYGLAALVAISCALGLPAGAAAGVDPASGTFGTSVSIAVPAYHGLEPKLGLTYNSARGNGKVGVGWDLSGVSVIERASPGRGTPRYDASDIYLLDGQELYSCATPATCYESCPSTCVDSCGQTYACTVQCNPYPCAGPPTTCNSTCYDSCGSPYSCSGPCPRGASCSTGGTHSTRLESYQRIQKDVPSSGQWTVTARDGTRVIYNTSQGTAGGVVRWAQASVVDPRGNTVTYSRWSDPGGPDSYLDRVTYNGTVVKLYWEERPDPITEANGYSVWLTRYRLKTIDVCVRTPGTTTPCRTDGVADAARARAYKLLYTTGGTTSRSLLQTVQQYGRDATLDASGTVSGGSALPATTLGWQPENWLPPWSSYQAQGGQHWGGAARWFADINGDGKADYVAKDRDTCLNWNLSTGSGWGLARSQCNLAGYGTMSWLQDINGDGKADYVTKYDNSVVRWNLATADGWAATQSNTGMHGLGTAGAWLVDINGDGKADYVTKNNDRCIHWNLGTTSGFGPAQSQCDGLTGPAAKYFFADINGDGKADYVAKNNDGNIIWSLSTGNGWTASVVQSGMHWIGSAGAWLVDLNGDGKADYVTQNQDGWIHYHLALSPRADPAAGGVGIGWGPPQSQGNVYARGTLGAWFVDVTGDGVADYVTKSDNGDVYWHNGQRGAPLVTSVANGLGGTSTVTYTPSSAWSNANNPPVMPTALSVRVTDGRGGSATTGYEYSGGTYDRAQRLFRGFTWARERQPCLAGEGPVGQPYGPYTEAFYAVDELGSRLTSVQRYDSVQMLARTDYEYALVMGQRLPQSALATGTWEYRHGTLGSNTPSLVTYQKREYDVYGNVTRLANYGDYAVADDESITLTTFSPNPSLYIVDKPAAVQVFQGLATTTKLAEVLHVYDANTSWGLAPTQGLLTQQLWWVDTTDTYVAKKLAYDSYGNVTKRTTELGDPEADTVVYDPTYHLYPLSVTNALERTVSSEFDYVLGVQKEARNANQQLTTRAYDPLGRLTRTAGPLGGYESKAYSALGYPTGQYIETRRAAADGAEQWERTFFDGLGRTYKTVARGVTDITTQTEYNARGQVDKSSAPYAAGASVKWTTFAYDTLNRVTRATAPGGKFRSTYYYLAYNPVDPDFSVPRSCRTDVDELGHGLRTCTDVLGRTVTVTEFVPGGEVRMRFAYDQRGELARVTDGGGSVRTFSYNSLGWKLTMTDPNAGTWSYGYDAVGRLTQQTDALLQATTFAYDVLGRRTQKVVKRVNGTTERTVTWGYDQVRTGYYNVGQPTSMADPSGTVTYDYDAAGRLLKASRTVSGTTYTMERGYGTAGQLLWTKFPDGTYVGTAAAPLRYDAAGRLTTVPGLVTGATYTAAGALLTQTNANGTVTTHTYDTDREWLKTISTLTGTTTIQNLAYTRDDEGQVQAVTSPFAGEGWAYGYDTLHRLTAATNASNSADSQTFAYAANGNMSSSSRLGIYSYPGASAARPHAVTTAGANSYSYDANGNLLAGAGRSLTWTPENLPATIGTATLTYDGNGMRLKKVVGSTTTVYLGADYEVTGTTATKYVAFAGRPVAKIVGTTKYWLHTDDKGSVQAVTNASGLEVQRLKYRPYGERLATGTSHVESRSYLGQRQDESGLLYLHARYYDPALGRFISPDPVLVTRTVGGPNGYAYSANDPVNRLDVDGQKSRLEKEVGRIGKQAEDLPDRGEQALDELLDRGMEVGMAGVAATLAGNNPYVAMLDAAAGQINQIPWVGGILALPFVGASAYLQGDMQAALRAFGTCVLALAAISAAAWLGAVGWGTGVAWTIAEGAAAFAAGFVAGFLIGKMNGASTAQSVFAGAAFGVFCFTVWSAVGGVKSLGDGYRSRLTGRAMWKNATALGRDAKTLSSLRNVATATSRRHNGPPDHRFDYRWDYVGPKSAGGNTDMGPLAGNTPWNYGAYLHDMAAIKEGYVGDGNQTAMAFDAGVWVRTLNGDSIF